MNDFRSWYGMQPPALRALLTINVVFYVLWLIPLRFVPGVEAFVIRHLALTAEPAVAFIELWQLLTYSFLHLGRDLGGFLHILFNMLWLVWMSKEFEVMQGSHRVLALYVISAVGGALLAVGVSALVPGVGPPVFGAGTAIFGIMAAIATFYPYQSIGLFLIGTVRLLYLLIAALLIDFLFNFLNSGDPSFLAHLGGAFFGFLFAKSEQQGANLSGWARVFFGQRHRTVVTRRAAPVREQPAGIFGRMEGFFGSKESGTEVRGRTTSARARQEAEPAPKPGRSAGDIDRILDKISARGYESLSDEEKQLLYEASKR